MKKIISFSVIALLLSFFLFPLTVDNKQKVSAKESNVLNIMNTEDYIAEADEQHADGIIDGFIKYYAQTHNGEKITVNYSTQGTNENMYSQLEMHPGQYDLLCVSEYMIQKLMVEGKLEKLDHSQLTNYDEGISPAIENIFKNSLIETPNGNESLYDYACCYMWGTMGFVYNPQFVDEEEVKSWDVIWNDKYRNKGTIKNSVRDSYVLAIGYAKRNLLNDILQKHLSGEISDAEYNSQLTQIFNDVSNESLVEAGNALKSLTPKLYGFEVDSGKKDMAAGKIWLSFAWSGDSVYSLDYAEDPEMVGDNVTKLYYTVPKEGSNLFFDAWAMPKGANTKLAQAFLDYIQRTDNAIRNMDYSGYTTPIATDEVFKHLVASEENGGYDYGWVKDEVSFDENGNPYVEEDGSIIELYAQNLNYLFGGEQDGKYIIYAEKEEKNRQLDTQYPDEETLLRCTIMRHFNDEETNALTQMWLNVISGNNEELPALYITILVTVVVSVLLYVFYVLDKHGVFNFQHPKKGYYPVAINGKPIDDDDDEDENNDKQDKKKNDKKQTK